MLAAELQPLTDLEIDFMRRVGLLPPLKSKRERARERIRDRVFPRE